jgi:hypothetical protein
MMHHGGNSFHCIQPGFGKVTGVAQKKTCTNLAVDTGSILFRWTSNEKEDMRW